MKNIKIIEHTADIGFEIKAKTKKKLFEVAVKELLKLIFKEKKIKSKMIQNEIKLKADTDEELLHNFLNEILFLIFVKKIFVKKVKIINLDENKTEIKTSVYGFLTKKTGNYIKRELKSVTYHGLKITKENQYYNAKIIIDI